MNHKYYEAYVGADLVGTSQASAKTEVIVSDGRQFPTFYHLNGAKVIVPVQLVREVPESERPDGLRAEDIRAAAKEAKESVAAAADTGAEWAIEKLPRDVAGLVDVLLRDSAFLDALERRGIDIRRRPIQPRKYV